VRIYKLFFQKYNIANRCQVIFYKDMDADFIKNFSKCIFEK